MATGDGRMARTCGCEDTGKQVASPRYGSPRIGYSAAVDGSMLAGTGSRARVHSAITQSEGDEHMLASLGSRSRCALLCIAVPLVGWHGTATAAKASECTKIGICYCVNPELKATIDSKTSSFRQLIADQHKKGKAVGYLSVPLSPAGGGYMKVNMEVAESAKAAVEKRFGPDFAWVLNPGTADANLPGGGGADYMLLWTSVLEGPNGLGEDFDFVYFVGPQDFARYFDLDGSGDMAKIDQFYEKRLKSDPDFERAAQGGLTRSAFRNYYAL